MPMLLTLKIDKIFFRALNRAKKKFLALNLEACRRRIESKGQINRRDLFTNLLEAKDSGKMTMKELTAEAGILVIAGGDTVATVMTAVLFYCLHHPSCMQRLQAEIRDAFADWEDIRTGDKLNSCQFLRACIDESMRMTPPVGALLPREVLSGGLEVDGNHYPPGTDIGVPHYALYHNEEFYNDPFAFKPERWIADDNGPDGKSLRSSTSEASVIRAQSAFCAFSVGRAACIGKNLAYQEMCIILARMIWIYDMRLQGNLGGGSKDLGPLRDRKDEFQTWEAFISVHQGPIVKFNRRI